MNPEERGRLGIMLSRFGHEVRFSMGKDCPLSREHDLVIVDDKLTGQTGLDFIKKNSSKLCGKVIYLSSYSGIEASLAWEQPKIYEWITKPFDPLNLAVVVCDYFVELAGDQALPAVKNFG